MSLDYRLRTYAFKNKFGRWLGPVLHHFWWVTHNCIVHPLVGILPIKPMFKIHDFTSNRLDYW